MLQLELQLATAHDQLKVEAEKYVELSATLEESNKNSSTLEEQLQEQKITTEK